MTSASLPFNADRQPGYLRLPGHRMLLLGGRDALAFAQSQFCNDVATLADGQWQWNAWLSAKGRVIALFMLQRENSETLRLLLPDHDPEALATGLQRYVFRSKVDLAVAAGSLLAGTVGDATRHCGIAEADLDLRLEGTPLRHLHSLATSGGAELPDGDALWRLLDIRHGIPRLCANASEAYTAHMLGLDALGALALKKGCYPGQEIVARTHYLGRSKRSLQRLLLESPGATAGDSVLADGAVAGELVATAAYDGAYEALALLPTPATGPAELPALKVQTVDGVLDARASAFVPGQRSA